MGIARFFPINICAIPKCQHLKRVLPNPTRFHVHLILGRVGHPDHCSLLIHIILTSAFARLMASVTLSATAMTSSAFNRPVCPLRTPSGNPESYKVPILSMDVWVCFRAQVKSSFSPVKAPFLAWPTWAPSAWVSSWGRSPADEGTMRLLSMPMVSHTTP